MKKAKKKVKKTKKKMKKKKDEPEADFQELKNPSRVLK